jgi:hypothetical protein
MLVIERLKLFVFFRDGEAVRRIAHLSNRSRPQLRYAGGKARAGCPRIS